MTGNVRVLLIDRLMTQFPIPKTADENLAAWEQAYVEALSGFSDAVLTAASKKLISEREVRSFPLVSECLKACRQAEVEAWRDDAEAHKSKARELHPEWSDEARREADHLLATYADRHRALKEGWAWGLWDFMREQARWPNVYEADKIRAKSMAQNRDFEAIIAGGAHGQMKQFIEMRRNKFAALSRIINGTSGKADAA